MSKHNLSDNQIADILKKQKVSADKGWEDTTYRKLEVFIQSDVTEDSELRTGWSNLIFNLTAVTKKRALMYTTLGVVSIALVGGGLWGYSLFRNQPLSAAQQREILSKIIANNGGTAIRSPQTVAQETTTLSARNANAAGGAEAAADMQTSLPMMPPVARGDYNYRHSKNTYTTGPAASRCLAFGAAGENSQYESYEFTDKNGASYYKSISNDQAGNLLTYSLSINSTTGNEYYEYRGGQFAVKTVYTNISDRMMSTEGSEGSGEGTSGSTPPSEPAVGTPSDLVAPDVSSSPTPDGPVNDTPAPTEPTTGEDLIKQYFGENAQVKSTEQENGQEFYVIQYSFPVNCDEPLMMYRSVDMSKTKTTNNVIYVSWVNSRDFVVSKTFSYLDSEGANNLIDSTTQTGETKNTDFASVANDFKFDYSVTVRTLDTNALSTTPEQEAVKAADYMASLNVDVLLLNHPTMRTQSIYAYNPEPQIPEGWDYFTERSYYPAGARGDKMHSEATSKSEFTKDHLSAQVTVSASDGGMGYFSMEAYPKSYTSEKLLENRFGEYTVANQQNLNWSVEGQAVVATLYTVEVKSWAIPLAATDDASRSAIMPVEPGYACEGEECKHTEKVITMAYGNNIYLIGLNPELDVNTLQFDSYNTKNAADMQFLRNKMMELVSINKMEANRAAAAKEAEYAR